MAPCSPPAAHRKPLDLKILDRFSGLVAKHDVQRHQAELVKSTIKERGTHRVIDKHTWAITDGE